MKQKADESAACFYARRTRNKKNVFRRLAAGILGLSMVGAALAADAAPPAQKPDAEAKAKIETGSGEICLPILMYHEVKYKKLGKDVIAPQELESDLAWLKKNGYHSVFMKDLIAYVRGRAGLPEKPIVLTFDDGYLNNYIYAYPLMQKYDMKMVFSIIGSSTDDFTKFPDSNLDYSHVTWSQLLEMLRSGRVEVQNHTYGLHRITRNRFGCQKRPGETQEHYEGVLTRDIGDLQTQIRLMTGVTPDTFTYPYGKVSKESRAVLKRLGFQASLSCDFGVNRLTHDPECLYGLRRIARPHGVSAETSLRRAMKTLRYG